MSPSRWKVMRHLPNHKLMGHFPVWTTLLTVSTEMSVSQTNLSSATVIRHFVGSNV